MRAARRRNTGLQKAKRLFKERKYTETIRLLEPQVFTYRENAEFYHFLGVSCLKTGDFAGAYSYLKRAVQLEPDKMESRLALAVVHLKRMETQESLRLWLEIIEEDPSNRFARKGLDAVKAGAADEEGMEEFFETGGHHGLIPSAGVFLPKFAKIILAVAAVVCIAAVVGVFLRTRPKPHSEAVRPEIARVVIDEEDRVVDTGEKAVFMLSEKEIRSSFEKIKDLFEKYRDNEARREINRLLMSNAGRAIKDKVGLFLPYIRTPNFADFPRSFTYQEVADAPLLHEGCFVRWKGRVSNVRISDTEITYDFLAGYEEQKVLYGIVPARMTFAAKIDSSFAYEIIGKIVPKSDKAFSLEIVSIHELGL